MLRQLRLLLDQVLQMLLETDNTRSGQIRICRRVVVLATRSRIRARVTRRDAGVTFYLATATPIAGGYEPRACLWVLCRGIRGVETSRCSCRGARCRGPLNRGCGFRGIRVRRRHGLPSKHQVVWACNWGVPRQLKSLKSVTTNRWQAGPLLFSRDTEPVAGRSVE